MRTACMIALAALLMGLSACPEYIGKLHEIKREEWRAAHPGEELTDDIDGQLLAEARAEATATDREGIASGGKVAAGISTGNIALVIGGALGLLGVGTRIYRAKKGAK